MHRAPCFPPPGWVPAHVGALAPYVGADVQQESRAWIEKTDEEARAYPVFQYALAIQDTIFAVADELGIGSEVREIVYGIRSFEYAGTLASSLVGTATVGGAAAGASALTITGGIAALGAVAVVWGIADALFGAETDVVGQMASAAKGVLHLRDRLSLAQFAEEQDVAAAINGSLAGIPLLAKDKARHAAAAATAQKLAQFYRTVPTRLDSDQREVFESISNLSRWDGTLREYARLPPGESYGAFPTKATIDKYLGAPLPTLIQPQVEKEQARLAAILQRHAGGGSSTLWSAAKVGLALLVGGAFGLYVLERPLFNSLLRRGAAAARPVTAPATRLYHRVIP